MQKKEGTFTQLQFELWQETKSFNALRHHTLLYFTWLDFDVSKHTYSLIRFVWGEQRTSFTCDWPKKKTKNPSSPSQPKRNVANNSTKIYRSCYLIYDDIIPQNWCVALSKGKSSRFFRFFFLQAELDFSIETEAKKFQLTQTIFSHKNLFLAK